MKKPNDQIDIPNAQTINLDDGRDPYFVIGDDRAQFTTGEAVAAAVSVNMTMRDGERSRGHSIALHEVPLMRRLYGNGTVVLHTEWVPGVNRCVPLTRRMFEEETKRLVRTYTIPIANNNVNKIFAEVYGDTEADATKKLHEAMGKLFEGWKAIEKKALAAFKKAGGSLAGQPKGAIHGLLGKHFTTDDLESLIALIEPKAKTLESVELASIEIDEEATDEIPENTDGNKVLLELTAELIRSGFTRIQADEIAILAIEAGPELADDLLAQSSLAGEDGKVDAKLAKKARKVTAAWAESQKVKTG